MFDLGKIARETSVRHVEYHETLDSTNKLAVELLTDLRPVVPAVVLTSNQTAGRGRGSNSWWATPGSLTFSVVHTAETLGVEAGQMPLVSLATGLAVQRVVAACCPQHAVSVKWPNDVLVRDQKICGILTQLHNVAGQSMLIIGVGLNVNNSLSPAPESVRHLATSLFDVTNEHFNMTDVLVAILKQLDTAFEQMREDHSALLSELNACSALNGRRVAIQIGDTTVRGICNGIDDHGYLVVANGGEKKRVNAGTVVEW